MSAILLHQGVVASHPSALQLIFQIIPLPSLSNVYASYLFSRWSQLATMILLQNCFHALL